MMTSLWANSADDIFFFFPENRLRLFMQIVSLRERLNEMPNTIFWEKMRSFFNIMKYEKHFKMSSAEKFYAACRVLTDSGSENTET